MKKSVRGFTIVELLVVIAIIAILAAVVTVTYNGVQARTRDAKRKSDIANIIKALELYYDDNGSYPIASGTNSSVNTSWYSSDTTSWNTFKTTLANATSALPTDPSNKAGNVTSSASALNYAYFGFNSASYCGAAAGQGYIIVYRLESSSKEQKTDGDCSTGTDLGASYYSAGASYYRSVKR